MYYDKLEKLFSDSVPEPEVIKGIVFGRTNETIFVSSDRGAIYQFSLIEKEKMGDKLKVGTASIDILYRMEGIATDDILITYQPREGLRIISWNERKINEVDISMIVL